MDLLRVFDLKAALFSLTNVPPERQKILGLVKGKLPPDEECVSVSRPIIRTAPDPLNCTCN